MRLRDKSYLAGAIDILFSVVVFTTIDIFIMKGIASISNQLDEYIYNNIIHTDIGIASIGCINSSINAIWQEMIFGTTMGMKIFGLAVRAEDGNRATKKQIIIRNLVYPLDTIYVIGSVGLNKPNGRSLGDYISKTKLVRIKDLKD